MNKTRIVEEIFHKKMNTSEINPIVAYYQDLRNLGVVHTQKEFASKLGVDEAQISKALKGDRRNLTPSLIEKAQSFFESVADRHESGLMRGYIQNLLNKDNPPDTAAPPAPTVPVLPVEAIAGNLNDFSEAVRSYDCELMISPIKGVDFAIKVSGDSMTPEYPAGCVVLIKKIDERAFIEWGRVYVLDTDNGCVIKRIRPAADEQAVECVSVSPDYPPFTIKREYIRGWYRVLMMLDAK